MAGLGGGPVVDGQANNGHDIESAAIATLSTSVAPVSTLTRGLRAIASLSTSVGRGCGRLATASPSIGAPRGRGWLATASPSTSAATGCGLRATTPQVVTTSSLLAPISHASPQPRVPSPTPPSQPSFNLGINFHLTPPIHPETPSYPPTCSSAPTMPIDPPTSSSSDPLGPLVGIDTVQLAADVPDEHPPPQPLPPQGRPQRARRAPTCGIGGHKIGRAGSSMV